MDIFERPHFKLSSERSPAHQAAYTCTIILYSVNLILSVINFTFGIVSWIMLPKWRQFRHYIYMNLIVASTMNMIGFNVYVHLKIDDLKVSDIVFVFLVLIPRVIMSHWLLITIFMLYRDIVKAYTSELKRPFLIANAFSWFCPIIEALFVYAIDYFFQLNITFFALNYVMNLSLMAVSTIIYFMLVFNIIRLALAKKGSRNELLSKIIVVTLSSIPSGLSTLMPILLMELMRSNLVLYNLGLILCLISITSGHVVFMFHKPNRQLWAEYRRKRSVINNL